MYSIEGGADRQAEGIYDLMRNLGAHEVLIESPDHYHELSLAPDAEIAALLRCWALRINDLKNDTRLRYVTVFKNRGVLSGQQLRHAHSELVASAFIPRRVLYELRSCKDYYQLKERCVFCDILHQEERHGLRVVDISPRYLAVCPFASRVPYEIWILPRRHQCSYEEDLLGRGEDYELAGLLRRILARLEHVAQSYHLVLHTSPNVRAKADFSDYWLTLPDDYHWHIEIMPILEKRSKSYSIKETYYCALTPEAAAARLRDLPTSFAGRSQSHFRFERQE
jgi:UDPglucose--hexose-1-phosphate uridylyltransferase